MKEHNSHVIEVPEEEEKGIVADKIFEEVMTKIFQSWGHTWIYRFKKLSATYTR